MTAPATRAAPTEVDLGEWVSLREPIIRQVQSVMAGWEGSDPSYCRLRAIRLVRLVEAALKDARHD